LKKIGNNLFVANDTGGLLAYEINYNSSLGLALRTSGGNVLISGYDENNYRYLNFGNLSGVTPAFNASANLPSQQTMVPL